MTGLNTGTGLNASSTGDAVTDVLIVIASENISAGDLVNIWNNSGVANARRADASVSGKQAHGFVLASVSQGANATVYFEGAVTGLSGMTPGATQFLSDSVAGGHTETAPVTAGHYMQVVGTARGVTIMDFEVAPPVKRG